MRTFAGQVGFEGDDSAWAGEFQNICLEVSADHSKGVSVDAFARILNDKSEKGCFCTEAELYKMLPVIKAAAPPAEDAETAAEKPIDEMSREEVIGKVFSLCDVEGFGILREKEMRSFAACGGFTGSAGEWAKAYRSLCTGAATDPAAGLDIVLFEQVVDDGIAGSYTDDELRRIGRQLESEAKATH